MKDPFKGFERRVADKAGKRLFSREVRIFGFATILGFTLGSGFDPGMRNLVSFVIKEGINLLFRN